MLPAQRSQWRKGCYSSTIAFLPSVAGFRFSTRSHNMLLALQKQGALTLYPMAVLREDWPTVYSDLPRDIEVMNDMGPALLEAFLRHRRG